MTSIDDHITQTVQQKAARAAGALYLCLMITGMFDELFIRANLVVANDAAQTASNILASELLFRFGIVVELITCAGDIALAASLYTLLSPISRGLALLGAFWRLAEGTIFGVVALSSNVALLYLGDARYLHSMSHEQLQTLARIAIRAHAEGFNIGLIFLALGASLFAYLLRKSRYVPWPLATLGLLAYPLMLMTSTISIIFPHVPAGWSQASWIPAFAFEVGCGLWFLLKKIDFPESVPEEAAVANTRLTSFS